MNPLPTAWSGGTGGDADAPSDGPYRERFAEICHSLNQAGVAYSATFDSEGGRDYALIETTHG